jgi:hypothetical protein
MRVLRRVLPSPRTLRGKVGIAAFITTFLVLASTTASFAFWTGSVGMTSTLSAANLTISTTNLTSAVFNNGVLASQGSITITNSTMGASTKVAAVSVTVIGTNVGTGTLANNVTRQMWTVSDPNTCATATAPTGTTVNWSTSTVLTFNLAPSASANYCVRSVLASRASVAVSGGTQTFTPSVTGTITLNNFTGSANATASQKTQAIYPVTTPVVGRYYWIRPNFTNPAYDYCLDVSGAATSPGTIVISYGCKTSGTSNQQWKFTAGATDYYSITPRNAAPLRMDNNSSTSSNSGIIVDTAGTGTDQQWQLQAVSTGVVQIVNSLSGMCLTSPDGSATGSAQNLGQITQTPCVGGQFQQFLLSEAFENFTCTATNGNTNAWVFGWTNNVTGPYYVQQSGSTTNIASTASTAAGVNVPYAAFATSGTYNLTFTDANGTYEGAATVTVTVTTRNTTNIFGQVTGTTTTRTGTCAKPDDLQ